VRQPRQLIGERAAQLLFDEIENPAGHVHQQIVFTPELVVRDSSRQA
jgi:LacI family transcriptional regulator